MVGRPIPRRSVSTLPPEFYGGYSTPVKGSTLCYAQGLRLLDLRLPAKLSSFQLIKYTELTRVARVQNCRKMVKQRIYVHSGACVVVVLNGKWRDCALRGYSK